MLNFGRILLALVVIASLAIASVFIFNQGTEFSKLTFDLERKKLPLIVLHLETMLDGVEIESFEDYRSAQRRFFFGLDHAHTFDGVPLFSADGTHDREWDRISIASFARTGDYVNAITAPEYTDTISSLTEEYVAESATLVGHGITTSIFDQPIVLLLGKVEEGVESEFIHMVSETLTPFHGTVSMSLPVTEITVGDTMDFNYLAIIEFSESSRILGWLDNTIRKAHFSLLREQVTDVSLIVAKPS